jgi:hypothetical protein
MGDRKGEISIGETRIDPSIDGFRGRFAVLGTESLRSSLHQRQAIQKFHGDERLLSMFADFVDCANIGMVKRRCGTRLPAKTLQCLQVSRQLIGKEFESDEASKLGVLRFIDDAHASAPESLDDAVVRDGLVDH